MEKPVDISNPEAKWLRPKEIKIGTLLPVSVEGNRRFESRRGFKPQRAPQTFHVSTSKNVNSFATASMEMVNVHAKGTVASGSGGVIGAGSGGGKHGTRRTGVGVVPTQTILSEDAGGAQNIWSSSVRAQRAKHHAQDTTSAGSSNPTTTHTESKASRGLFGNHGRSRCLDIGGSSTVPADAKQSLLIEGNSVWSGDIAFASHALDHLTTCVKEERRWREQLEKAKYAKLQAFRSVTSMFRNFVESNPSIRTHPEAKTIARCSVVTTTLVTIIQTFLRYYQSKQLVVGMRNLKERMRVYELPDCERTAASTWSERAMQSIGSDYDKASRSVENLLDEQEINKLKQLYFDYYDCEVVSLGSPELSNASEFGDADGEKMRSRCSSKISASQVSSSGSI